MGVLGEGGGAFILFYNEELWNSLWVAEWAGVGVCWVGGCNASKFRRTECRDISLNSSRWA